VPNPSSPFDLDGILALLQIQELGSVQAAANRLGSSRATVRRRIEELEAVAGVALLQRDRSGARLTRAGQVFAERGRAVLASAEAALNETRFAAADASGLVRIVLPVGLQLQIVAGVLASVRASGLDVRMSVEEVADPAGEDARDVELMFHFGPPPDQEAWFSRVIRRAPLTLVASPAYLARHGAPQSPEEMGLHALLMWRGAGQPTDQLPLRSGGSVRVLPWLVSPNINLLRRTAALGVGIAFAPDGGVPDEAGVGPLVPVLQGVVGRDETLRATSPLPSRVDPRSSAFVERVHQVLSTWPEP
jgi:DNA-binding transcriptional LysR family regulator